jgi:hypothetical protein
MSFEYDEKGKIYTNIVRKKTVNAMLQTTTHLMRGKLHIRQNQRVKDELDLNESFLALTDVSVLGVDGKPIHQAPFLAVSRSQIVWVIPEEMEEGSVNE